MQSSNGRLRSSGDHPKSILRTSSRNSLRRSGSQRSILRTSFSPDDDMDLSTSISSLRSSGNFSTRSRRNSVRSRSGSLVQSRARSNSNFHRQVTEESIHLEGGNSLLFQMLTRDYFLMVFYFLDMKSLAVAKQVCKAWNELICQVQSQSCRDFLEDMKNFYPRDHLSLAQYNYFEKLESLIEHDKRYMPLLFSLIESMELEEDSTAFEGHLQVIESLVFHNPDPCCFKLLNELLRLCFDEATSIRSTLLVLSHHSEEERVILEREQVLMCCVLESFCNTFGSKIIDVGNMVASCILPICETETCPEESLYAAAALVSAIQGQSSNYLQELVSIFTHAFRKNQPASLCLLGDLARAVEGELARFSNRILSLLCGHIGNVDNNMLLMIVDTIGDIAIAVTDKFERSVPAIVPTLLNLISFPEEKDTQEQIDFKYELNTSVFVCLSNIVQGLYVGSSHGTLNSHINPLFNTICTTFQFDNMPSEMLKAMIGLIGDLANTHRNSVVDHLPIVEIITKCLKHRDPEVSEAAEWARKNMYLSTDDLGKIQ